MKGSDVNAWATGQVARWAKQVAGLDDDDAAVLTKQKVTGKHLERLTAEKLNRWGMAGAPAEDLVAAIDALLGRSTAGVSCSLFSLLFAD